jgi:hypothetical protein
MQGSTSKDEGGQRFAGEICVGKMLVYLLFVFCNLVHVYVSSWLAQSVGFMLASSCGLV